MNEVTWFDQKRFDEIIKQASGELDRRHLFGLIGKPSEAFRRAQSVVEFAMMYAFGEKLYATVERPECLGYGPNRLAFVRGAAQKAFEAWNLPEELMFRLVSAELYCYFACDPSEAREVARWMVCLELTEEAGEMKEMGYRFPEEQVPYLL
jgi:hypothetical protein